MIFKAFKSGAGASVLLLAASCVSNALETESGLVTLVHDPIANSTSKLGDQRIVSETPEAGTEASDRLIQFSGPADVLAEPRFASYEVREGSRDVDQQFVSYSVIHPDERSAAADTTSFPESATVQIKFQNALGKTYGCSGAMISPDFALTAGHCVYDDGEWSKNMLVWAGRNGAAQPFGACRVQKMFALEQWISDLSPMTKRDFDIAGIKLDCSVGADTGLFELATTITAGDATVVRGYPCDRIPNKQYSSESEATSVTAEKVFYQNDTYGCMSGGPVTGSDGRLIAIHTNGLHNGEPWASNNAATKISEGVLATIGSWMTD